MVADPPTINQPGPVTVLAVDGALAEVLEPGHSYFRYDPPLPDALSGIDDVRRANLHALRGLAERTLARHDSALRRLARRLLSRAG